MFIRYYINIEPLLKQNKINPFYNLEYHLLKRFQYPFYIHNLLPVLDLLDNKGISYAMDKLIAFMLDVEKYIIPYLIKLHLCMKEAKAVDIINNKFLVLNVKYKEGSMNTYTKEYIGNNITLSKDDSLVEVDLNIFVKEYGIDKEDLELFKFLIELIVLGIGIDEKTLSIVSDTLKKDISDIENISKKIDSDKILKYIINKISKSIDSDIAHYSLIPHRWVNNSLWVLLHKE